MFAHTHTKKDHKHTDIKSEIQLFYNRKLELEK